MSAAKITSAGKLITLDKRAQPDVLFTAEQAKDHDAVAQELTSLRKDMVDATRHFQPRHIDFEDIVTTSSSTHRLVHNFNSRVRWWVVDWIDAGGTSLVDSGGDTLQAYWPVLSRTTASDANMLVLSSRVAGTATIRVEEAG